MKDFEMQATVDAILGLYESFSESTDHKEKVLEHSVQVAQLAEEEGYDDEVILAAFFHDIGYLLPGQHITCKSTYGQIGSDYLRANGFSEKIVQVVIMQTEAHRYLAWKFPEIYGPVVSLSSSSANQMSEKEAKTYEKNPYFFLSLKVNEWNQNSDASQVLNLDLGHYRAMALNHLQCRLI